MTRSKKALILIISLMIFFGCAAGRKNPDGFGLEKQSPKHVTGIRQDVDLPELNDDADLDDYVLYALLNNSGLRASFNVWKAALEKIAPSRTLPDPRFSYANYIREVETRVGAQKQKFGLAQTFPWFGELNLQGEMAAAEAHAARQRYEAEKLKLIYQVKKTFFEYWYLARAIDITKDNITLLAHFENVARAKYRTGSGLQSAVIKTQVELGKLQNRLHSQEDLIGPIVAKLNFVLNRPTHLPLPVPKNLPEEQGIPEEDLKVILRDNNPELNALDFLAKKDAAAIELAKTKFFPNLTVGVDYIQTDRRSDMNPKDNGKDPVIAMLSVNLPIWHGKYHASVNEAHIRRRARLSQKIEKQNALNADLEMALYQLRDAKRKIDLYKNTLLPMAEQNINITQAAFTADKSGFTDLIDSQRIFLGFQLDYERALTDRCQRIAEIKMLIGERAGLEEGDQ